MPSGSELQVLLGNVVVAQLSGDLSQPVLNWTSEWRQGGFLLAPSLPWEVNGLPPSGAAVRNFFENMLPEERLLIICSNMLKFPAAIVLD